ncbi:MAG TPA: FAD-dependent oxidoreductase, partial [Terracidiphilus sp.]|nr:FAD-dependent oxidoreductase [Terracidiphilus sp.]
MTRRELMGAGAALFSAGLEAARTPPAFERVRSGGAAWPGEDEWSALSGEVGGRLEPVRMPALDPAEAAKLLKNPFYLGDHPALTQSSGWIDAWRSEPSAYVVAVESASDVSAVVRFAAKHKLRLVVKGGGHSYLGASNAPDSLLIWTRRMNQIRLHDAFVPNGSKTDPVPAVSVGAGCIWLHVYDAVTTKAGRYVQGGGCTTVGVAGLVQGGGFGSFSKGFGMAAASLLEAEIVTADGQVRVVNEGRDPDLFWALKGGGGGTFGVVTRLT